MIGDRFLRVAHCAFVTVLVVASATTLSAQTVVDPQFVEFAPSADHSTLAPDGTPIVQRYSLTFHPAGSSVVFDTMDLGKPTPSGGIIRVDFLPLRHVVPTPGAIYEARVTAIGPGGSTASTLSNNFTFQGGCVPTLSSTGQSVGAGTATGSVGVTAATGCAWTAVSNNTSWLTVTGGASGSGNGTVTFSASSNPNTSSRTGTITIAGQTFTVTQAAAACTYALLPASQSVVASGGTGTITVSTLAGCAWTAVSNNTSWLTVTSGASGTGTGTVGFSAAANPNTSPRTGTLTIGGQTFTVTQAAASCTYALAPTSQSVVAAGGTGSTAVTTQTGCAWTGVSNNTSWLTVTSGATGSGNGSVAFSAAANASTSPRTGTLTIGGRTFTVAQAAAACTYAIAPTSQSVVAGGGTGSTTVTTLAGCGWTGVSFDTAWLTVTSGASGTGTGTVAFSAAANTNTSSRVGTLNIAGQMFTVTQPPCTYSLAPTSQSVVAAGGTGSTAVTALAGCPWTGVSNNTSWLTVTSGASGTGNGSVAFSAAVNPNPSPRTGTLSIAGQIFSVTQAAASCTYALAPTSQSVVAAGGTGSTAVTAPAGCTWTGVSNDTSWLTVTSGATGSGNGSVAFSASSNPNTSPRTGTLTIGGQTFSVTQAAASCTYALVPTSQSVVAGGGTGSTTVTTLAGCAWTGVSNDTAWLTVTSGASGTGTGTVGFSAAANPNTSSRTGTLTIAGQTFTVSQAASSCTYALAPTSQSVVAGGGTGSTAVTAPAGCAWTGVSNNTSWLTVTSGASGTGNGSVAFSATSNPNTSPRTGTLTIGGQTFSVTQAAASCTYALVPTSQLVVASGGTGSTTVTTLAGCAWTGVSNNTSWLTVTSGATGSGNGSVAFSASSNPNTSARTGTLTIGGQTFTVTQAAASCTYSLAPTSQSVVASGGTGSTTVTTLAGCAWTGVSNNTSWLTVTSGATGSGNGTVAFSASSNPNTSPRTGTLTIGGQTFSVTQAAASCTYSLAPVSQSVVAGGGTGSTAVTAPAGCAWTGVSNNTSWLTVTSGASGSGNGTVAFSAAANPNTSSRTGTLTIGGQTFTVTQAAASCTYALAPTSQSVVAGGGTGSTAVTAPAGCAWTGRSNDRPWLTVTSGASGSGNGTVSFSATANASSSPRTGTLTIGEQTFTVTQAAASCTYALLPTSQSVVAGGGTGSTTVTAAAGCAWTGVSNDTSWLTVTSGATGSGNGSVAFSATANPNTSSRTGTLTVAGQTFTVTQAAASCTYALAPTSQSVVAGGGTGSTAVTAPAGCAWTGISNNTSWLTVTSGASGSGNGTVAFSASSNPNTSPRTGTLTIGGQTFSVTQAAASCTYALVPTSQSVVASGGTGSTTVTTLAGCAWTGVSNDTSWLTVTSGATGSGGGTVAFSAAANPNTTPRNGTLTVAGQTFTVTQAAASCTYALAPTSQSVVAGGGTGSTAVTAPAGCAWTGVSNNTSWLTVTSGATGSGNGTVAFSASSNPNTSPRTGTLTIGGQTFSVTQAAASCTYALVPTSQSVVAGGGTGSTTVTTLAGCAWTGVSNDTSWLTVTSGASGSGNGTVAFSAAANANTSPRTGTLTIGGQTFSVTQAAASCTYALAPTSQSVVASGGTGSTTVTTLAGCAWTGVSNDTSWLTVTSGASGSGNGTVGFSAAANPNTSPRSGTLTIGGQTFSVTQAAASCTYALAPTSQSVVADGGAGSTAVTAPAGCAWTGVSNDTSWLTVTSGASGSGNGTVGFSATANASATPRSGTLTVGGQTFTVTQGPAGCAFSISPSSQSVSAAGESGSATVTTTAGCTWTAVSNATWITVTGATGSGGGTASFTVAPNTIAAVRTGTLTIAGNTFNVSQAANTCNYVLTPPSTTLTSTGGSGNIGVATASGCTWVASTTQPWISVSGTATESGTATYTVQPNTGASRVGAVSIGTQVFTVIQNGVTTGCTYSISPASQSVAAVGGSGLTTVTTQAGCPWTGVSNDAGWLTLTSGATGSGGGSASFSAAANTATSPRTGTLTIAGQTFTVTQAAAPCSFAISPSSQSVPAAGGNASTTVTTTTGCTWTTVSNVSWITVTGGASGSGSGSASFTVAPSTTSSVRTGTLTIAGRTFTVTQAANTCSYTLSPASISLGATGGSGNIGVTTGSACTWLASTTQTWITVSGTGTTSGTATYTVQPNTGGSRVGAVSIGTQVFTVIQAASTTAPLVPAGPPAPRSLRIVVGGAK